MSYPHLTNSLHLLLSFSLCLFSVFFSLCPSLFLIRQGGPVNTHFLPTRLDPQLKPQKMITILEILFVAVLSTGCPCFLISYNAVSCSDDPLLAH